MIDFKSLRKKALENVGKTPQQVWWQGLKKLGPVGGARSAVGQRKKHSCTCVHRPKHHKKTGHCRPGCDCKAGIRDVKS